MEIRFFCTELMALMPQMAREFSLRRHHALWQGTITPGQLWGLDYLLNHGPCPMTDLARYLGIARPSATALINRLIGQGLVVRLSDARDRRMVKIVLSPRGKKLVKSIKRQKYQTLRRVFGRISNADRQEYLRILKEVIRSLNEAKNKGAYR